MLNSFGYNSGVDMDVNENTYEVTDIICATGGSLSGDYAETEDEGYISYYLNSAYTTLTGTLYRPYETLKIKGEWEQKNIVKIYDDDVLLYEAPKITKDTYDTTTFEIDVTGIRELKIVMLGVFSEPTDWLGIYRWYPESCLTNVVLSK